MRKTLLSLVVAVSLLFSAGTAVAQTYYGYSNYGYNYGYSGYYPYYSYYYPYYYPSYPYNNCLPGQSNSYPYNTYNYSYGYNYGYPYYGCPPSISKLSPTGADVGDRITMYGSGFSTSGNTVRFGVGVAASNVSSSDNGTRITFTVPHELIAYGYMRQRVYETTYPVSVMNSSGYTSNSISLRVTDDEDDDDNDDDDEDLEIKRVSGPSSLDEDERGTWTVEVDGDETDHLTFTVDWDDDSSDASYTQSFDETISLSHEYDDEGEYDIRFTVRNDRGDSDSATKTVDVDEDNDDDDDEDRRVSIDDNEFEPETVRIDRGTRVTWENDDNVDHTVRSLSSYYFSSGILDPEDEYSHTFNTTGTFYYYCSLHPDMRGTIIVE